MATGLDVAAGVAGLITLADVVITRTWSTIKACRSASEDAARLQAEMQSLHAILSSLNHVTGLVDRASLASYVPVDEVYACQKTLRHIGDKLKKSDPNESGLSTVRKWKRTFTWPFSTTETEELLSCIERHKSAFNLSVSLDTLNAMLTAAEQQDRIENCVGETRSMLSDFERSQRDEHERRMFEFFGTFDTERAHEQSIALRQPGTGLWFTNNGDGAQWLRTPNAKLWMSGIAGAGKTILTAAIVEEATRQFSEPGMGVAYYYCDSRSSKSQQLQSILASLAGQLATQSDPAFLELSSCYRPRPNRPPRHSLPDDAELIFLLEVMVSHFDQVAIIVDGLDECVDLVVVAQALADIAGRCSEVRMLLSSRPQQTMKRHLRAFEEATIAAREDDLRLYVGAEIHTREQRGTLMIKNRALKDEIFESLVNGADGMFQWVACQLDNLSGLPSDAARKKALRRLPQDLYTTYDRILQKVNERQEEVQVLVRRTLWWLFSGQSLTNDALCDAISVDPDDPVLDLEASPDLETVLTVCSSLIRVGASNRLELAHFTVKEYLGTGRVRTSVDLQRYSCQQSGVATYQAMTCLASLNLVEAPEEACKRPEAFSDFCLRSPLYSLAASAWPDLEKQGCSSQGSVELVLRLFSNPSHFLLWKQAFLWSYTRFEHGLKATQPQDSSAWYEIRALATQVGGQHILSTLGLSGALTSLLHTGLDVNEYCPIGTPLHCALCGPSIPILDRMSGRPVDVRLETACDSERRKTITLLLNNKANAAEPFFHNGSCIGFTGEPCMPLSYAIRRRTEDIVLAARPRLDRHTICDMLDGTVLEDERRTEFVTSSNFDLFCALSFAPEDEAIRLILIGVLSKLAKDESKVASSTALTVQRLAPKSDTDDALAWACAESDTEAVIQLVDKYEPNLNRLLGPQSQRPFHLAVSGDHLQIAAFLLDHGAEVDAADVYGSTALHHTLLKPSPTECLEAIRFLVSRGADINKMDGNGDTCLHLWARRVPSEDLDEPRTEHERSILSLLVRSGAEFNKRSAPGATAFHLLAFHNKFREFEWCPFLPPDCQVT